MKRKDMVIGQKYRVTFKQKWTRLVITRELTYEGVATNGRSAYMSEVTKQWDIPEGPDWAFRMAMGAHNHDTVEKKIYHIVPYSVIEPVEEVKGPDVQMAFVDEVPQ